MAQSPTKIEALGHLVRTKNAEAELHKRSAELYAHAHWVLWGVATKRTCALCTYMYIRTVHVNWHGYQAIFEFKLNQRSKRGKCHSLLFIVGKRKRKKSTKHSPGYDSTRLVILSSSCGVHHVESSKTKFEGWRTSRQCGFLVQRPISFLSSRLNQESHSMRSDDSLSSVSLSSRFTGSILIMKMIWMLNSSPPVNPLLSLQNLMTNTFIWVPVIT